MDKAIIAIDGFASTGKSTLAKMLSKFTHLPYIDSGALFRGITFLALEKGWIVNNIIDEISIEEGLQEVKISFDPLTNSLNLNKRDITNKIRSKSSDTNDNGFVKLKKIEIENGVEKYLGDSILVNTSK